MLKEQVSGDNFLSSIAEYSPLYMNPFLSFIRYLKLILALCSPLAAVAEAPTPPFWDWHESGKITHTLKPDEPPVVLNMQGQQVVMETHVSKAKGLEYKARFFNVQDPPQRNQVLFHAVTNARTEVLLNGQPRALFRPDQVEFDGKLTLIYRPLRGMESTRTVYPSTDKALVVEEWLVRNASRNEVTLQVIAGHSLTTRDERVVVEWNCPGIAATVVPPDGEFRFYTWAQARPVSDPAIEFHPLTERAARDSLAQVAWHGAGRLDVPDPMLVTAYNLQKLHVLETPIQTFKGIIAHNGSLTYSPGVWANDPVEYSSPLFPFFGNALLNESAMNMYRLWLDYIREHGIDPYPGSFEYTTLQLVQKYRGDDAMVLYGLSKFLLFLGERSAAEEMWPLIEYSVASIEAHRTPAGIIASKTDEMEGRYPTGDANLSTSALAYGGYVHAAHLARALGKSDIGAIYNDSAIKLAVAIENYFGGEVEGFQTYRYYEGNTTLRGWILLPLAMDIWQRKQGTLDAMLSDQLWPSRHQGGDILAESTRETEWGRETYYALRVLFKAGLTDQALDLTQKVVRAQIFGPRGPYPDEDAIDMLCPGSLYPRVFTEGLFGIVPTGLDSFECTPWLPSAWPRMALRDLRAFGKSWDLIVERESKHEKVTVISAGKAIYSGSAPAGATHRVKMGD